MAAAAVLSETTIIFLSTSLVDAEMGSSKMQKPVGPAMTLRRIDHDSFERVQFAGVDGAARGDEQWDLVHRCGSHQGLVRIADRLPVSADQTCVIPSVAPCFGQYAPDARASLCLMRRSHGRGGMSGTAAMARSMMDLMSPPA